MNARDFVLAVMIALLALASATTVPWVVSASLPPHTGETQTTQVVHSGDVNPSYASLNVYISPAQALVYSGGSETFTAGISPANLFLSGTSYSWSLSSSDAGTLQSQGRVVVFTASPTTSQETVTLQLTVQALDTGLGNFPVSGSATDAIQIIPTLQTGPLFTTPNPASPGSQITLSIQVQGGEPPFQLSYDCGDGIVVSSNLAALGTATIQHVYSTGTYTPSVTVTDQSGRSVTESSESTLVVTTSLAVAIQAPGGSDVGHSLSVSATVAGGEPPYTFQWSNSEGGGSTGSGQWSFVPETAGSLGVSVSVTDALGDTTSANTATIDIAPSPSLSLYSSLPTADLGTPLPIVASISGGIGPYTLSWTDVAEEASFQTMVSDSGSLPIPYSFQQTGTVVLSATLSDSTGASTHITETVGAVVAPPKVSLTVDPATPTVGVAFEVYGTVNGGTAPYSYTYAFAGSVTSLAPLQGTLGAPGIVDWSGVLPATGPVSVELIVKDASGGVSTAITPISGVGPLLAHLLITVPHGQIGELLPAQIEILGGTPPYSFTLTGTDGEAQSGLLNGPGWQGLDLQPTVPGNVTYTLSVTDQEGHSISVLSTVRIAPALTASLSWDRAYVDAGQSLPVFVNVSGGWPPYTAEISQEQGTPVLIGPFLRSSNSTLFFPRAGTFDVSLEVADSTGVETTSASPVTVAPDPAASVQVTSLKTEVGVYDTFSIVVVSGTGPFNETLCFGDGNSSHGPTALHTYARPGTYLVNASVRDAAGNSVEAPAVAVTVVADPQVLALLPSPFADQGHSVAFGSEVEFGTPPYSFAWNFGDGTGSLEADPSHTYSQTGLFRATLTVTDALGVSASSPVLNLSVAASPLLSLVANQTRVDVGQAFQARAVQIGGSFPSTVTWAFGDGSGTGGTSVLHEFAAAGTYTLSVTDTDGAGVVVQSSLQVQVSSPLSSRGVTATSKALESGVPTVLSEASYGGTGPLELDWTVGAVRAQGVDLFNLSVTPAAAGILNGSVNVTDAAGIRTCVTFTFAVWPALSLNLSAAEARGEVGVPLLLRSAITGGVGPYSFSYTLPAGTATGGNLSTLAVLPSSAGELYVSVTVTDALGVSTSAALSVGIASPLQVSIPGVTVLADAGIPLAIPCLFSGGSGHLQISTETAGGGDLNGTVVDFATPGTYPVVVWAADSDGAVAMAGANVTVEAPLTATFTSSPSEVAVGSTLRFAIATEGGAGLVTTTWSIPGLGSWNGDEANITFARSGTFHLSVATVDGAGGRVSLSDNITAWNDTLSVEVNSSTTVGIAPFAPHLQVGTQGGDSTLSLSMTIDGVPYANLTSWPSGTEWDSEPLFTVPGTYQITVRATDDIGGSAQANLDLNVCSPLEAPQLGSAGLATTAGVPLQLTLQDPPGDCAGTQVLTTWWGPGISSAQANSAIFENNASGTMVDHVSTLLSAVEGPVLQNLTVPVVVRVFPGDAQRLAQVPTAPVGVAGHNLTVTFAAVDAFGNANTSFNGSLQLSPMSGGKTLMAYFEQGVARYVFTDNRSGTEQYAVLSPLGPVPNLVIHWWADSSHVVLRVLSFDSVRSNLYLNVSVTDEYGNPLSNVSINATVPGENPVAVNATNGYALFVLPGAGSATSVLLQGPGGAETVLTIGQGESDPAGGLLPAAAGIAIFVALLGTFLFLRRRGKKSGEEERPAAKADDSLVRLLSKWPGEDRASLIEMAGEEKISQSAVEEGLSSLEKNGKAERFTDEEGVERWKLTQPAQEVSP